MLRTETRISRYDQCKAYQAKYLINKELEWLIECGEIRESIYFKGATGDRYTIYVATRRNSNIIDFHSVQNSYSHDAELGAHIGTLRGYVLTMNNGGGYSWYSDPGWTFKQLMRQGVMSKKHPWKIRFCRSAYFVRLSAPVYAGDYNEFSPWNGMKIDLKNGILINKPNRYSISNYKKAKETDRIQRKRNRIANKNNTEALERYRKAGGDTNAARGIVHDGRWREPVAGEGTKNINWDLIPIDDIFKHRNATLRSNILEHYGIDTLLKTLKHDVVDIDFLNNCEYKLLNVEIPDESTGTSETYKGLYLQMLNPSTGESHFEGVANVGNWNAPREATVKEALAWRDGDRNTQGLNSYDNRDGKTVYVVPVKLT